MPEGQGGKVGQLLLAVAGSDRELTADEAVDPTEAGGEELLERVPLPGLELTNALEEAGECLGLDVGGPLGERPLAGSGQLPDARQQHSGEGDRRRASFRLGPAEQDADGGVADPERQARSEQAVAELPERDLAGRKGWPDEASVKAEGLGTGGKKAEGGLEGAEG